MQIENFCILEDSSDSFKTSTARKNGVIRWENVNKSAVKTSGNMCCLAFSGGFVDVFSSDNTIFSRNANL